MARAWLSLGSNLAPEDNLRQALVALREAFGDLLVSTAYRSAAVGFEGPAFINLAVGLDTSLDPVALNAWLHALEDHQGRRRDVPRFSSRTLDIDIVLYDNVIMEGEGHLKIPRDELKHAFVLRPLAEIAPDVVHPLLKVNLAALWACAEDAAPLEPVSL